MVATRLPHVFGGVLVESPSLWVAEGRCLAVRLPCGAACTAGRTAQLHADSRGDAVQTHKAAQPTAAPLLLLLPLPPLFAACCQDLAGHSGRLPERLSLGCGTREYSATRDHERHDIDGLLLHVSSRAVSMGAPCMHGCFCLSIASCLTRTSCCCCCCCC